MVPAEPVREVSDVLVTAAVSQELADFQVGEVRGVQCLITGMGARVGESVRRRLRQGDIGLVVSTGFAGGVRPGFEIGDLVMASEVIHSTSGRRWKPNSVYCGLNGLASVGPFVTVDRVLADPQVKSEAGLKFGAIAADLETAAVAEAANQAGVAWLAVRAILDPMETQLQVGSWREFLKLSAIPGRWKDLSSFLAAMRTASRSLAGGLKCVVERIKTEHHKGE